MKTLATLLVLIGRTLWPMANTTKSEKAGTWITVVAAVILALGMALDIFIPDNSSSPLAPVESREVVIHVPDVAGGVQYFKEV